MNERIQELADLAEGHADIVVDRGGEFHPAYTQKLAELIVQDMLRLLEQYSRDSFPEDDIDEFFRGYLGGLHTVRWAVEKHFGVK